MDSQIDYEKLEKMQEIMTDFFEKLPCQGGVFPFNYMIGTETERLLDRSL